MNFNTSSPFGRLRGRLRIGGTGIPNGGVPPRNPDRIAKEPLQNPEGIPAESLGNPVGILRESLRNPPRIISIFQELSFSPVSSAELQSYISYSRKFKPYIPIKLTDYISGQYAELRAEEKEAGENSTVRTN